MTKFHINKHGVPAPCKAKKGNCPLGGADTHFDNIEDAQDYANAQMEQSYGFMPEVNDESQPELSLDEFEKIIKPGDWDGSWQNHLGGTDRLKKEAANHVYHLKAFEKKYGIPAKEIAERKYLDGYLDRVPLEELAGAKERYRLIEELDEDIGERQKRQFDAIKEEIERSQEYHKKEAERWRESLSISGHSEGQREIWAERLADEEYRVKSHDRDIETLKKNIERYDRLYNDDTKAKREIDRMYFKNDEDVEYLKRTQSEEYRNTINNENAYVITKEMEDIKNVIKIRAYFSGNRFTQESFMEENPKEAELINKYNDINFLKDATKEDLLEAVENIKGIHKKIEEQPL